MKKYLFLISCLLTAYVINYLFLYEKLGVMNQSINYILSIILNGTVTPMTERMKFITFIIVSIFETVILLNAQGLIKFKTLIKE